MNTPITADQIRQRCPGIVRHSTHNLLLEELVEATAGFTQPGRVTLDNRRADLFLEEADAAQSRRPYGILFLAVAQTLWEGSGTPTTADLEAVSRQHSLNFVTCFGGQNYVAFRQPTP